MTPAAAAAPSRGAEPAAHALHLPAELLLRCLEPLNHLDLLAASAVSREWREVASSDQLWQAQYLKAGFCRSESILDSRLGSSNLGCPAALPFAQERRHAPVAPASSRPAPPRAIWRRRYRRRAELEAGWRAGRCTYQELRGHHDYIRCAQLEGASLATCSGSYMQRDCSIRLWDIESGECQEVMRGHEGPIWSMHFDGAARRIASCGDEGSVRLWDLQSHRVGVASALMPHSLKSLSMDGCQLAVGGESGMLALWSLAAIQQALEEAPPSSGEEEEEEEEDSEGEQDPAEQRQRQVLRRLSLELRHNRKGRRPPPPSWQSVALEGAGGVRPSLARAPHLPGAAPPADIACLQVEGGLCAAGDAAGDAGPGGGLVHLWGTQDGELQYQRALPGHGGGVTTLSFQRATGWLVAGSGDGPVRLWDLERGELLHELRGHDSDIMCHQQSGALLATGSADCTVRLWDLRSGATQQVLVLGSFPYSLQASALRPQMDDWRLAVGCANGTVQVAELRGGRVADGKLQAHAVLPAHKERAWALALSESRLVSASLDSTIYVRSFLPDDQTRRQRS